LHNKQWPKLACGKQPLVPGWWENYAL
jgi:hypothetical protein